MYLSPFIKVGFSNFSIFLTIFMYKFTSEDLVQFLYRDTSADKIVAIHEDLNNNWSLKEEYDLLLEGKRMLQDYCKSPRKSTIENILRYAEHSVSEVAL